MGFGKANEQKKNSALILGKPKHGKTYKAVELLKEKEIDFEHVYVISCSNVGEWANTDANYAFVDTKEAFMALYNEIMELPKVEAVVIESIDVLASDILLPSFFDEGKGVTQRAWGSMSNFLLSILVSLMKKANYFITTTVVVVVQQMDGSAHLRASLNPAILNKLNALCSDIYFVVRKTDGFFVSEGAEAIALKVPKKKENK